MLYKIILELLLLFLSSIPAMIYFGLKFLLGPEGYWGIAFNVFCGIPLAFFQILGVGMAVVGSLGLWENA